ncbi:hypothetical protein HBH53_035260 [Parastagonospora nodorum]|nr:hypothetical protein HBH53_035260 [Parastagonospora nodorum]KAH3984662.1 hypothetical protein HBH51_025390 [Parastagonospora nodorum]KAH5792609.1 hypothetical protein HBI97_036660 [Parastagonospora nodorum]KAH5832380.1 hypothetical protein HBI96_013390 [Parastagonospora nodorum]KAH5835216.1 hypothetical protein HBI94_017820 [Parastagonospora nodorum]
MLVLHVMATPTLSEVEEGQDFEIWRLRQPTARSKLIDHKKNPVHFDMLWLCLLSRSALVNLIAKQDLRPMLMVTQACGIPAPVV